MTSRPSFPPMYSVNCTVCTQPYLSNYSCLGYHGPTPAYVLCELYSVYTTIPIQLLMFRLPRPNHGFTAVILAYDRLESLFLLISKVLLFFIWYFIPYYSVEISILFSYPQISEVPSLARIVVVWNHQVNPPPHVESWPKIAKPLKVNFCPPKIIKNAERNS